MIELYTGTPGSGKSLHCAKIICNRLNRGKGVIANFDINLTIFKKKRIGEFHYIDNADLSPDMLMEYAVNNHKRNTNGHIAEAQTLLVIDECQILFNSRDWQARDRMKWATFFTQHRKYGYNIILITQFDRLIDRQIRSLVEYQVIHRKASNYKTLGLIIGMFFRGNIFVAITQWYGVKEKINSEWFVMRPKYARLYDSYKIFGAQSATGDGPRGAPVADCGTELTSQAVKKPSIFSQIKQNKKRKAISFEFQPEEKPSVYASLVEFWTNTTTLN